jgi:hypothetical protein
MVTMSLLLPQLLLLLLLPALLPVLNLPCTSVTITPC